MHAARFNSYLTAREKVQSIRIRIHYQGFKNNNAIPEFKYQPWFYSHKVDSGNPAAFQTISNTGFKVCPGSAS